MGQFKFGFSNVYTKGRSKEEKFLDKLDGKVLEAIDKVGSSQKPPITPARVSKVLGKDTLKGLKAFGGVKGSIKRLEDLGCLIKDEEWGWILD